MSKTYSLPGLRVGWICANKDLIEEVNHQRQYNTISISALDDYYAAIALENHEKIEKRNLEILKKGVKILTNWAENEPFVECICPEGGTTSLVKYLKPIPSKELCHDLQQKTGVALLPGETLEMEGYVRIGFGADNLKRALENFSEYLNS